MLGKILKFFVGDKSKKDLKTIMPIIDQIHSFEDEIGKLSNDELRNQTSLFKEQIKSSVSDVDDEIENLKIEVEKTKDFDKKESLFTEIDKLNEEAYKINENTLNQILPKAFAVIKETAKRFVDNKEINISSPQDAIKNGIVMVPEDRKSLGLLFEQSNSQNISIANFDVFLKSGWVSPEKIKNFSKKGIELMGVKGGVDQNANELSGGNQQKLLISKWISRKPKVLIFDEPTNALDIENEKKIMHDLYSIGGHITIIIISHRYTALEKCKKVLNLKNGKIDEVVDFQEFIKKKYLSEYQL